jgi:flagellar biosynthesis protein FlhF
VQKVLQNLLRERVSIRASITILEALGDAASMTKNPVLLGCDVVETPLALAQAINKHRSKHLILIDTPGLSTREMEDGAALAELLASPDIDTHLVLPASMKAAALARIVSQYAIFQPKKLIFTRIDEIADYTDLLIEAARCALPVSFLCGGQRIPDDIEPATPARLSELAGLPERHTLGATA